MKQYIIIITIVILSGCTSGSTINPDRTYQGAGVEQYFLSQIPQWVNFSSLGQCQRQGNIRFLNFKNLGDSYALDYEQSAQLQYMFNRALQKSKFESGKQVVNNDDESFLFYNSYEKIIGGSRDFVAPTFERVHLVFVDKALTEAKHLTKLKELMNSKRMEKGHPIFVSYCHGFSQIEEFITKNGFDSFGVKHISMEMFSNYNERFEKQTYFEVLWNKILANKVIYIFAPEIPGKLKKRKNIFKI